MEEALEVVQKRQLPMADYLWNDAESGVPQWTAVTLAHWGVQMFAQEISESASPVISQGPVNLDEIEMLQAAF